MTPLADGRVGCSHIPEAHVSWVNRGWRAEAYCRCRKVSINGKRLHATFDSAERATPALLALLTARAQKEG